VAHSIGVDVRTIVGSSLAAGLFGTAAFGACRTNPADVPPPTAAPTSSALIAPGPSAPSGASTSEASASAAPSPENAAAEAALKARSCTDPVTAILNHPDGGVVFNNAMTSVDAGFIDRTQGVLDALSQQATAFRCCFDGWLRAHPGAEEKVMLRVVLTGDGQVEDAAVDPSRSSVSDAVTVGCVVGVARDTPYPKSPTGKQTVVEYPLRVAAMP
jgi:hypothetical protein